jgi:hypothetical protein
LFLFCSDCQWATEAVVGEKVVYVLLYATARCFGKPTSAPGIMNGPITYEVDGKQYVAVIAGLSLSVFAVQ